MTEPVNLGIPTWTSQQGGANTAVFTSEACDKLRRKALSPSTAKSMEGCTARWAAERLGPRDESPFDPAPLGTSAHSVLEKFYELHSSRRTSEELRAIVIGDANELWGLHENLDEEARATKVRWAGEVWNRASGILAIEEPRMVKVHENEMGLDGIQVNGVPFNGYIDRTDFREFAGTKEYRIVDYKGGRAFMDLSKLARFGDSHGDQLRLYVAAFFAKTGIRPVLAQVFYIATGEYRDIDITEDAMADTLARYKTAWRTHNELTSTGVFPTKPSGLCPWCPLVQSCPSASAAHRAKAAELEAAKLAS